MFHIWNLVLVLYSCYTFHHQHGVTRLKLKQNVAVHVTWAKLWICGLNFPVRITNPTYSWMRTEFSLEHMEAAQGCSLLRDGWSLYMVKCHAVNESLPHCGKLTAASFCMLLGVYYSSSLATSVVLWPHYTLNKLDTLSNVIYVVRNCQAGYETTSLLLVVTTTALESLNNIDPWTWHLLNHATSELYAKFITLYPKIPVTIYWVMC